jgi:hypothetical protein
MIAKVVPKKITVYAAKMSRREDLSGQMPAGIWPIQE